MVQFFLFLIVDGNLDQVILFDGGDSEFFE